MSDDLPADLARHQPIRFDDDEPYFCDHPQCCTVSGGGVPWPCDAARAAERIRELEAERDTRDDLIATLHLYVGRYVWTQLTTEQKGLFADVVEEQWRRNQPDEPAMFVDRWWLDPADQLAVHERRARVLAALDPAGQPTTEGADVSNQDDRSNTLRGRYDDDRSITVEPSANHEVAVKVGNQEPVFLDGLDFLWLVSDVVLSQVYGPSLTAEQKHAEATAEYERLAAERTRLIVEHDVDHRDLIEPIPPTEEPT